MPDTHADTRDTWTLGKRSFRSDDSAWKRQQRRIAGGDAGERSAARGDGYEPDGGGKTRASGDRCE